MPSVDRHAGREAWRWSARNGEAAATSHTPAPAATASAAPFRA